MPRNPFAVRCAVPNCRSWAMRGHVRCRAHRDAELGPRGAGAPPGNLNALSHGAYSHPMAADQLENLVRRILDRPDDVFPFLAPVVRPLWRRTADPFLALAALRAVISALIARVAARLFDAELDAYLAPLPPDLYPSVRALFLHCVPSDPEARLLALRRLIRTRKKQRRQNQSCIKAKL